MLARADHVVAASPELQTAAVAAGRQPTLLTHGVDVAHWGGLAGEGGGGRHARPAAVGTTDCGGRSPCSGA